MLKSCNAGLLTLLLMLSLMTACQPAATLESPATTEISSESQPSATATAPAPTDTPGPTPVFFADIDGTQTPTGSQQFTQTPLPDPLRFVFPTPGSDPVSDWRPPLYAIPWALTPYDHFFFARPIAASEAFQPDVDYRYGGVFFADNVHTGIDIPALAGTPIHAAGPGRVIWSGIGLYYGYYKEDDPYGLAVVIQHDFGYQNQRLFTVYAHMRQIDVVKDQWVDTGDVIGTVGQTGFVTGAHLHFEVRVGEKDFFSTKNPELWLVPPQGYGVLAGRVMDSFGFLVTGQLIIVDSLETGKQWLVRTYGFGAAVSDPYYNENFVLSDLPAGLYEVRVPYVGINYTYQVEILPGRVSYLTFKGRYGFTTALPPTPTAAFTPSP